MYDNNFFNNGIFSVPEEYIQQRNIAFKTKRKPYTMSEKVNSQGTLCWCCKHAVPSKDGTIGCNWSKHLEPVEGWEAIENTHSRRAYGVWDNEKECFIIGDNDLPMRFQALKKARSFAYKLNHKGILSRYTAKIISEVFYSSYFVKRCPEFVKG